MNARDVAARRMHGHRLWGSPLETPRAVVGSFAAMQAQEFVPAKWSVAQRTTGLTESTFDRAFASGTILRTHVLRPTWHFVVAEDVRWLLDLTGPRVNQLNAYYYRKFGLDDEVFATCNGLFRRTLTGGRQHTRRQLADVLLRAGIEARGLHLGYILMRAELDAVLISGALSGRQQTYALFDDRVPDTASMDRDAALAELTRRYFTVRGPATTKDFATWSSLTVADATRGLDLIAPEVEPEIQPEVVDARTYWSVPSPAAPAPTAPVVDLIQGYDEYVMSYSESKDVLSRDGQPAGGVEPAYLHAILLDGQVIGRWKHTATTRSVTLDTAFDRRLTADEVTAMESAVAHFGQFLERPATWR